MRRSRLIVSGVGTVAAALVLGSTLGAATASAALEEKQDLIVVMDGGWGKFKHFDEVLSVTDNKKDGKKVTAYLRWDGKTRSQVSDPNGSADGSGSKNLSIREGTQVKLNVCVGSTCSGWTSARA